MTEKLKMEQNPMSPVLETIKQVCPGAVNDNGTIDFDVLKSELSDSVVEGQRERYEFDWVGKENAKREYRRKIRKTLRPQIEDSKNWKTTKNLYIEGDNLDALKLLQKSYLHKVKMIYIDPPYNTGNDFVYCDDFAEDCKQYLDKKEVCDADGNRLFVNKRDNGQYHSNWCNMMYPRLRIAKDLLTNDGVIFISIDDNEQANLRKICDEIFDESNFVIEFVWKCRNSLQHEEPLVSKQTERICLYCKNKSTYSANKNICFNRVRKPFDATEYKNPDNDPRGPWLSSGKTRNDGRPSYTVTSPTGVKFTKPWIPSPAEFKKWEDEGLIWWGKDGNSIPRKKSFLKDFKGNAISDILFDEYTDEVIGENNIKRTKRWEIGTTESGTKGLKELFDATVVFDYPKPYTLIEFFCKIATNPDDIILDFFSGSATTAHAVMQLNAEDDGNRKFIMVQLPEPTAEDSEAFKAGYKNICEIGKERICRAGDKIVAETGKTDLDIGFRVLRVDSSNMKEVYYKPSDTQQSGLLDLVDNIEDGRTDMDLLFGVMVDCGLPLDMPIETKISHGKTYYVVNNADLIACFEDSISEDLIREIAEQKPICAVFKDSSFAEAKDKVNVSEIFKNFCGDDNCLKIL